MNQEPGQVRAAIELAIEESFERAFSIPGALECRAGCADCCVAGLTVTEDEATRIAGFLEAQTEERRRELELLFSRTEETHCVGLTESFECSIYAARPTVCRSHGLPYRLAGEPTRWDGRRHLPMAGQDGRVISTCSKNFSRVPIEAAPRHIVIDEPYFLAQTQVGERSSLAGWVQERLRSAGQARAK